MSGMDSNPDDVERALAAATPHWTLLRPTAFAGNALHNWASGIRSTATVCAPFPMAANAPIHEADIAETAARTLLEDGHDGRRHELTGPESLTFAEQVAIIGRVIGKKIAFVEESPEQARARMAPFMPQPVIEALLRTWAAATTKPAEISPSVERITGHPPRSFADWVTDHRAAFIPS